MPDKVKPLKLENSATGGTENDMFPTEADPTEDYLAAKGISFENSDTRLIDLSGAGDIQILDNTEVTPIELWKFRRAEHNIFDNTGIKFNSTTVQDAIEEIRSRTVFEIEMLTSSIGGNHNIAADGSNIHIVSGTASGYSVTLPDATTLFVGRRFEVTNENSLTITVKDNSGATLVELISGDSTILTLEDNVSAAGSWLNTIVTSAATGITSYVIETDTAFTTSSATEVLITGFSVTPVTGRYAVWFNGDINVAQSNKITTWSIYTDGVAETTTRRENTSSRANDRRSATTVGEIIVDGTQAIDVRVSVSGGSLDVLGRTLILIRLGA